MPTFDDFRNRFPSLKDASDEEIIKRTSELFKLPITDVAHDFGYDLSGSQTSQRVGASLDKYQAGLYGVGEAVAGAVGAEGASDWMAEQRRRNEAQAQISSERARELGAVESFKEARETGRYGNWLGGLAIQSAPYAAEALGGGLVTRGIMSGTRAALAGAQTVEEAAAAKRALDIGSQAGAVAASYPSAVGDILGNQREQAGRTDLGSAAALAVPYAALNAVGVESALAKGQLFKNTVNLLDRPGGLGGALARTAATATGTALKEGASETGQEMMNQLGRMAVDEQEQFFSEGAKERYLESFAGGAALGGVAGGALGGWRRSSAMNNDVSSAIQQQDVSTPQVTTAQFQPPVQAAPVAPVTPMAPAVSGGTTDIAMAQQAAQQEEQRVQQAQAQQAAREEFTQRFGGVQSALDQSGQPTQSAVFQNKPYHTREELNAAVDKLMAKEQNKPEHVRAVEAAYVRTNATPEKVPTIGSVVSQVARYTNGTASVDQAASRINTEIATLVKQGKKLDNTKLSKLAEFYENLTGEVAPAYAAAEQAQPTGAENGKLQTTTGMGEVPVQGGAGEAIAGGNGPVRPTEVEPLGAGSVGTGPLGLQVGQPSAGGVRASTDAGTSVGVSQPVGTGQGQGQVNVQATPESTEAGARGGQANEPRETRKPDVVETVSTGSGGPRLYRTPTEYYNSDLMHISPERRSSIVDQLLGAVLATKGKIKADQRVDIVRMTLMEGMTSREIAAEIGATEDAVEKQRERMGFREATADGSMEIALDTEEGKTFLAKFVAAAADFRSPEFPDGIGPNELGGLYAAKDLYFHDGEMTHVGEAADEEQEGRPEAALAEELYDTEQGPTRSMGTIKKISGAQSAIETVELAEEKVYAKIGKLNAMLDMAKESGDTAGVANIEKQLEAEWAKFGKEQATRAKTGEKVVAVSKDEEAGLTGKPLFAEGEQEETQGEEDAVQEPSAEEVPVRKRAGGRKAVGKGNAKGGQAATEGEAKVEPKQEEVIATPKEQYDALAEASNLLPPYEALDARERAQVDDQAHQGKLTLASLNTMFTGNEKFGKDVRASNPYTAAELTKEIEDFTRTAVSARKLTVVDSVESLLKSPDKNSQQIGAVLALEGAYGVAVNGHAFLIANRIEKGRGRAKFMHEVGAHLGLENLLPKVMYDKLTAQVLTWAKKEDGSVESELALNAAERVQTANTPKEDQRAELLAYFIEEAVQSGIDPTASVKQSGPLREWFRTLWSAFKMAVRKLGFNPEVMTAQDVVDMAFGAAHIEMTTEAAEGSAAYKFGFAGAKATGAATEEKQSALVDAQLSLANGEDPKAVWEKTGWYKGTDGQWRFEIDDTAAQFKGILEGKKFSDIARMEESTLGEVLSHDELFANYPELRDVKFEVRNVPLDFQRATQGWFDIKQNKLFVTPYAIDPLSTVLHEVQHWIQNKEGFENGANPAGSDLSNTAALKKLRTELTGHVTEAEALEADRPAAIKEGRYRSIFDEVVKASRAKDLLVAVDALLANSAELAPKYAKLRELDTEIERLEKARKVLSEKQKEQNKKASLIRKAVDYAGQMQDLRVYTNKLKAANEERNIVNDELKGAVVKITGGRDVAYDLYRLVAGEAEARNVQRRQKMTAAERKASFPESTMDVRAANTLQSTGRGGAYMSMRFGKERTETLTAGLDNVLPKGVTKPAKSVVTNLATAAKNGLLAAGITEDIVNMAGKYMRSAQDYLSAQYARQKTRLDFEMRIERILESFDKLPKNLQGTDANSVNRFILDSTMQKKWGFYPGEHRIGTELFTVDPALEQRFNAFPDAAQQLIRDVFEHGYTALELKRKAVAKAIDKEFAEREAAAAGDADMLDQLNEERKEMSQRLSRLQNIDFTVPYAYLGRYGDYVVVARSKEFKHWQERAELNDFDKEQAKGWLAENVSNPDHYVVQFVESQGEADQVAAELMATGKYDMDGTEAGPKETASSFVGHDLHMAVARARNLAERQKGEGSEELDKLLGDLYLMTAAENSARKSEIARKYVAGADTNMMRNLATSGRADAHFLSTMEHNDDVTEALERMRNEAKSNVRDAMPLYNELYKRQVNSLDYNQPAILSRALTQATSLWFLATSPAFYLQQVVQTAVLSLPYMSGRLGYFRSARAIKAAYGDVATLVKGLAVGDHIDFDKAPADVRNMLQTLVGMGKIDIGIDADAKARAGEHGVLDKVMRKLQGVNSRVESINRATAAIAAYRGYLQRYGANNTEAATKFAADVVSNTHGSYDGFNTPRVLTSDVGRVVGQFKRFQIIQLSMLGKLIHSSFKGASAEEKAVARRSLAFIGGHMAVLGGALGVPFVQQLGSILAKVLGDEDEPDDLEYKLRQAIGDTTMANLLLNGVPSALGVNLGGKLGMGNVASVLPFTDVDLSKRSGYEKAMVGLMGPFFGGLAPKFLDGAATIGKGEYYKGLELLMPNGIGNAMKGIRFATEGVTMRNGDVVLSPDEVSMVDAAFQAVGLPTTTITERQYIQKTTADFEKFYNERTTEIKGAYVSANREGDSEAMAEARKDWEELQTSRRTNGFKIQPMSELFKATVAAKKREVSATRGVETTKANRSFVQNII